MCGYAVENQLCIPTSLMDKLLFSIWLLKFLLEINVFSVKNIDSSFKASNTSWNKRTVRPIVHTFLTKLFFRRVRRETREEATLILFMYQNWSLYHFILFYINLFYFILLLLNYTLLAQNHLSLYPSTKQFPKKTITRKWGEKLASH